MGSWRSSRWDDLTFTTSQVTIKHLSDLGTNVIFNCDTRNGRQYVIRTVDAVTYNESDVDIVACLFINHTLPGLKYQYYHATYRMGQNNENFQTVRLISRGSPASLSDICNIRHFVLGTHDILVNLDHLSSASLHCPQPMLANFVNYTVFLNLNTTVCDGSGSITVCNNDTSSVSVDYAQCDQTMFYSTSGELSCVYWVSDGEMYYVNLLNTDVTVDNSKTFHFTCLVIQHRHGTTVASQWPRQCQHSQTPTSVPSSLGFTMQLKIGQVCYIKHVGNRLTLLFIIISACVAVLLVLVCIGRYRQQHPSDVKVKDEEIVTSDPLDRPVWRVRKPELPGKSRLPTRDFKKKLTMKKT